MVSVMVGGRLLFAGEEEEGEKEEGVREEGGEEEGREGDEEGREGGEEAEGECVWLEDVSGLIGGADELTSGQEEEAVDWRDPLLRENTHMETHYETKYT